MEAIGERDVIYREEFPGLRRVGERHFIKLTVVEERDTGGFGIAEFDVGKTQILVISIARVS